MEEKKLTDEEILKDIERSTGMPSYWKKIVLDLIHRLQGRNENLLKDYYAASQTCDEQKAENERLKNHIKAKEISEEHVRKMRGTDLRTIAELQKQVEKLKEENEYLDIVAKQALADYQTVQVQVDELTAFKNEAISMSLYGKGRKDGEEVAVKDTAKEIWEHIVDCFLMRSENKYFFKEWLQDRYGVEVE